MNIRISIFATHPVQYLVPIWRGLAERPGLQVTVNYFSDMSLRGGVDPGFGIPVSWDVPLMDGYVSNFVSRKANLERPHSVLIPNVRRLLAQQEPDVILVQGYVHGFILQLIIAARRLGVKIINRGEFSDAVRNRSALKTLVRGTYLEWFYGRMDALCYIGNAAKQHLERYVDERRLFFSPYSIDGSRFKDAVNASEEWKATFRRGLGITPQDFVILFSGKLMDIKRPMLLLDAIEAMKSRKPFLLVVGVGPLEEAMRQRASEALGDRFRMVGFVNQAAIAQYYAVADALVLPSQRETWGVVVNEAMTFGVPAIVSDTVGCAADLVMPGRTGAIFECGSAVSLMMAIQDVWDDMTKFPGRMRQNVLNHIGSYSVAASVEGITRAIAAVTSIGSPDS